MCLCGRRTREWQEISGAFVHGRCVSYEIMHTAIDLYCGTGGWSVGATDAGFNVALGVDGAHDVISLFKTNFLATEAVCLKLPSTELASRIPLTTRFIMASPPCTLLSRARAGTRVDETASALSLVEWTISFLTELQKRPGQQPFLWVLENVAHRELQLLLDQKRSDTDLAFTVLDMGAVSKVPQVRRRLLAGSPRLIHRLVALPKLPPTPATSVLNPEAVAPADALKSTASAIHDGIRTPCVRSLHQPAFCVVASHPHVLCTNSDAKTVRVCTIREQAALQTFPESFVFASNSRQAVAAIGNAVPPVFAKVVAALAMEELAKMIAEEAVTATQETEPVEILENTIEHLTKRVKATEGRLGAAEAALSILWKHGFG